jgi:nucleoside-diphosphate-sugar epimerase
MGEPARIFVTGARGFVGTHLVRRALAAGHAVTGVVRELPDAVEPGVSYVTMSRILDQPELLAGAKALVHAAAIRHRHGVGAREYQEANVDLVGRLLRASAGRVGRVVYVSSVGVYGFPRRLPVSEQHPYDPATLYSATKVAAEKLVRGLGRELSLDVVIARPCIVYGRGDRNGMMDKLAAMIRAGRYRLVGEGDNTLHHVHVDDASAALLSLALEPRAAGEDVIVAGPEWTTLRQMSERVASAVGRPLPRVRVPLGLARAVATVVDVAAYRGLAFHDSEPPINHEKLDVMTRSICFDITKLRSLGYRPSVGYVEGIARTLGEPAS